MAKKDSSKTTIIKKSGGGAGALYSLGLIGALVYYLSTAQGFWEGFLGFLKALVWPAFLVYSLLSFLAK